MLSLLRRRATWATLTLLLAFLLTPAATGYAADSSHQGNDCNDDRPATCAIGAVYALTNATSGNAARGKDGSKGNGKGNAADGNAPRNRDKIDNRSHSHKDGSTNDVRDAGGGKVNPSRASRVASEDAVAPETGPVTSPSAM